MVDLEGTSNPKEKGKNTPSFLEVRRSDETEPWSATAGYLLHPKFYGQRLDSKLDLFWNSSLLKL